MNQTKLEDPHYNQLIIHKTGLYRFLFSTHSFHKPHCNRPSQMSALRVDELNCYFLNFPSTLMKVPTSLKVFNWGWSCCLLSCWWKKKVYDCSNSVYETFTEWNINDHFMAASGLSQCCSVSTEADRWSEHNMFKGLGRSIEYTCQTC